MEHCSQLQLGVSQTIGYFLLLVNFLSLLFPAILKKLARPDVLPGRGTGCGLEGSKPVINKFLSLKKADPESK